MAMPKFEGRTVAGGRIKINGLSEGVTEPLRQGSLVRIIVEARVDNIEHVTEQKGGTMTRLHKLTIVRTCPADDGAEALLDAEEVRRDAENNTGNRAQLSIDEVD